MMHVGRISGSVIRQPERADSTAVVGLRQKAPKPTYKSRKMRVAGLRQKQNQTRSSD